MLGQDGRRKGGGVERKNQSENQNFEGILGRIGASWGRLGGVLEAMLDQDRIKMTNKSNLELQDLPR